MHLVGCIYAPIGGIFLQLHILTQQTVHMNHFSLVAVSQLLQCGCVTCCSWQFEMNADVPLCHMTQTLIYMAAACCRWLCGIFNNVYKLLILSSSEITLEICTE
jgi:hypothetical protein